MHFFATIQCLNYCTENLVNTHRSDAPLFEFHAGFESATLARYVVVNDAMIVPNGNHTPGRLRALKTATQRVPTAAAKCIGPLSCPRKSLALPSNAAVSRGLVTPHRFITGPRHSAAASLLKSLSSVTPTSRSPSPGLRLPSLASRLRQLLTPQSFTSTLVPTLKATKLFLPGHSRISSRARNSFARAQPKIPACGIVGPRVANRTHRSRESASFGFVSPVLRDPAVLAPGKPNDPLYTAGPKKTGVTERATGSTRRRQVHEHVWLPLTNLCRQPAQTPEASHSNRIGHVGIDEPGFAEYQGCPRRFATDGNIGEQATLSIRKNPRDQVKAWQSDDRVAEAPEPVKQDPLCCINSQNRF